jgi:hypothetical protein
MVLYVAQETMQLCKSHPFALHTAKRGFKHNWHVFISSLASRWSAKKKKKLKRLPRQKMPYRGYMPDITTGAAALPM